MVTVAVADFLRNVRSVRETFHRRWQTDWVGRYSSGNEMLLLHDRSELALVSYLVLTGQTWSSWPAQIPSLQDIALLTLWARVGIFFGDKLVCRLDGNWCFMLHQLDCAGWLCVALVEHVHDTSVCLKLVLFTTSFHAGRQSVLICLVSKIRTNISLKFVFGPWGVCQLPACH